MHTGSLSLNNACTHVNRKEPAMSEFKECPHGYDIACLICGFGTENGKRVDRRKPVDQLFRDAVEHGHGFAMVSIEGVEHVSRAQVINPFPCEELGDDFPIENHISPLCKSKDV